MRQIKFRVWDKLDKRYIYPDKDYHFVINLNGKFQNFQNGSGGDEYEIQQFTGIKDIDGKEIYEGDFVELWTVANQKTPNTRGFYEIIWGCTGFDLKCHETAAGDIWFQLQKDKSFENTDGSYFVPSKIVINTLPLRGFNICKVIGNIFEDKNERD